PVRRRAEAARAALERSAAPFVPSHVDPVAHNFVRARDGALYLIDWEYAAMAEPLWDLAAVAIEAELDAALEEVLLAAYFGPAARALQGIAQPAGRGLGGGTDRRRQRQRRFRGLRAPAAGMARGGERERGLSRSAPRAMRPVGRGRRPGPSPSGGRCAC